MQMTEHYPLGGERVVYSFMSESETGESYGSPVSLGWNDCAKDEPCEVFIRSGEFQVNIWLKDVPAFIKMMKEVQKSAEMRA